MRPSTSRALNADNARFEQSADPDIVADTHHAAGQLAESQGSTPKAIEQYRKALAQDPRHLPSLYRLGVIYAGLQQWDEALARWQTYVQCTGDDPTAIADLGYCLELAGRPAEAEETYRRGIALDSRNAACQINLGLLLARLDREEEAIEHLSAALPPAQAWYNLGSLYEELRQPARARAAFGKALQLDPAMRHAQTRLAGLE